MIFYPKKEDFESDVFMTAVDDILYLRITAIDENISSIPIEGCIIEIGTVDSAGNFTVTSRCVSIIGLNDDYVSIATANKDLLGKQLTFNNIEDCLIEVY